MAEEILTSVEDAIATVTLNRPAQRNAVNYEMWLRLTAVAEELARAPDVRCVVFRGAGDGAFSAGADIKDFPAHRHDSASAARYAQVFERALDAVEEIPKPTISMIRGFCVGGGLELATATDIRIAARGARFGVPVARLGIIAGFKEMRRIVSLVGPGHASYIVMSGRLIDSEEALRIGLLTRLVATDALEDEAYGLAREMASHAPLSHQDHKTVIRTVVRDPSLASLSADDRALQYRVFDTSDFREGLAAFVEKRRPRFSGR